MAITLDKQGTRIYFVGDTYPIKDKIKSLGGHFDGDKKQWWVGTKKSDEAEALVKSLSTTAVSPADSTPTTKVKDDARVVGKGKYKGRSYFILWMGRCQNGQEKARLTVLDGSIDFWVDLSLVEITKRYEPREYRGRMEHSTLGSIRRFVERVKDDEKGGGESPLKYPRTGCQCGSREGITQDTDCWSCRHDAE